MRLKAASAFAVCAAMLLFARTSNARGRSCREVSDVVGEQKCTRYGNKWSVEGNPGLVVGFGAFHREYTPAGHRFSVARNGKGQPTLFRFDGDQLATDKLRATGAELRLSFALSPYFYMGTDFGFGAGGATGRSVWTADGQATTQGNHFQFVGGAHFGGRIPLGRVAFRVEALSGVHVVSLPSRLADGSSAKSTAARFLFEPRIWADVWLSPSITVSPYVGAAALSGSEKTAGVMLSFHFKAFDGDFSL